MSNDADEGGKCIKVAANIYMPQSIRASKVFNHKFLLDTA